jgi:regulator of replication initiation timing
MTPASADEITVARWVEEGRHLLNHWQERIERLDELQSRLAEMAQEIGQLKAQVSRMDAVQAENIRLAQENEALLLERDQVRAVLTRIGELIQQASAARP